MQYWLPMVRVTVTPCLSHSCECEITGKLGISSNLTELIIFWLFEALGWHSSCHACLACFFLTLATPASPLSLTDGFQLQLAANQSPDFLLPCTLHFALLDHPATHLVAVPSFSPFTFSPLVVFPAILCKLVWILLLLCPYLYFVSVRLCSPLVRNFAFHPILVSLPSLSLCTLSSSL